MNELYSQAGMTRIGLKEVEVLEEKFGKNKLLIVDSLLDLLNGNKATLYQYNPFGEVDPKKSIRLVAVFDRADQEGDCRAGKRKFDALYEFSRNGIPPRDYACLVDDYESVGASQSRIFPYVVIFSPLSSVRTGLARLVLGPRGSPKKPKVILYLTTQNDLNGKLNKSLLGEQR